MCKSYDCFVPHAQAPPAALGKTDDRLNLASLGPLHLGTVEKTLFSMATPEFLSVLNKRPFQSLILMGIEVRFIFSQCHLPD